jgi:Flp pilus assembly pilin Flp
MDFSNIQAQQAAKIEGIREVKGSLSQAIDKTKNDGLKEVFFKAGGKEYVAFGEDLNISQMKNTLAGKFKGNEISIDFTDDETNTAIGGAFNAIKSTVGGVVEGAAVTGGAILGALSTIHIWGGGSTPMGPEAIKGALIVGAVSVVAVGVVGAVHGGLKGPNYEGINSISSEIK